jgi:anion-transporting  ArsA/GET3 family ATPase
MGTPVASVAMDLERFCAASRVVIVAGKGGVGKTTVTAALATAAARTGMSVLIVEVEGKSGLAACFGSAPLTYEEAELRPGLRARTLTPDDALLEYLDDHGMRRISRRLSRSGALDVVATAVPGMRDILVLGKVKQLERSGSADLIVLDAPAAGHAVSFLLSARGLVDAVKVGPIQKQAAEVVDLLSDPARCQVVLVTLPEETPVNELVDTAYAVEDRAGVALGPIVVNSCMPTVGRVPGRTDDDLDGLSGARADATAAGRELPEHELDALARAAEFRAGLLHRQAEQCVRLQHRLPLPQLRLPYLFTADIGPVEIELLADELTLGIATLDDVTA